MGFGVGDNGLSIRRYCTFQRGPESGNELAGSSLISEQTPLLAPARVRDRLLNSCVTMWPELHALWCFEVASNLAIEVGL